METGLAMLLAIAIFVGIPAVIGFAILGSVVVRERRAQAHRIGAKTEMAAQVKPAEQGKVVTRGREKMK
jgi:hypothetical protein